MKMISSIQKGCVWPPSSRRGSKQTFDTVLASWNILSKVPLSILPEAIEIESLDSL